MRVARSWRSLDRSVLSVARLVHRSAQREGGPLLPSNRKEQSALAPERAHPRNLCEPALEPPIVCGACEQILGRVLEDDARVRAQILDAVFGEPALHFADGVTMLLRMPVLISQPRLAALRVVRAIPKNRIEGHDAIA